VRGHRHRCYSVPWLYRCFFRVRTSPGFRVARVYGALQADLEHPGLYTVAGLPATTAVAMDFEYAETGFHDSPEYAKCHMLWGL